MTEIAEWLESEEFDALMQAYRHAPLAPPDPVVAAFEAVKSAIREEVKRE